MSRALLAATNCDNQWNVGRLITKGAKNIPEALELAAKEGKTKAYALLLLVMAAINDNCELIRRLFGEDTADCSNELLAVRTTMAKGLISTSVPLEMALLRRNKSVAEVLLLATGVHPSEGTVHWNDLGLNAIESTLLSKINWVKNLNLGRNNLSVIPTEISQYFQQVGD